jgi:hypothetical protein
MMFSDWVIQGALFISLLNFFFPIASHRRGICPLEFRIVSKSEIYQFIAQCRSRPTINEHIHVVNPG